MGNRNEMELGRPTDMTAIRCFIIDITNKNARHFSCFGGRIAPFLVRMTRKGRTTATARSTNRTCRTTASALVSIWVHFWSIPYFNSILAICLIVCLWVRVCVNTLGNKCLGNTFFYSFCKIRISDTFK
jgi:hypothetical protein